VLKHIIGILKTGTMKRNRDFKLNILYFGNYAYVTKETVFCYFSLWIGFHPIDPLQTITSWRKFNTEKFRYVKNKYCILCTLQW